MLLNILKKITVEEAKARAYLTEHETNLMKYLQQPRRTKIVSDLSGHLGMSRIRLVKTKRSLERKLSKLVP